MSSQIELAKNRLYGEHGLGATNIKLYLGTDRDVTPEEIAGEINRALNDLEAGKIDFKD